MRSVHENGGTKEAAMSGSLFSLPETQYINVIIWNIIDLIDERERQLPADRRSTIQQGFTASLLLTPLFFSGFFGANEASKGWFLLIQRAGAGRSIRGRPIPRRAALQIFAVFLQIGPCHPSNGLPAPCRPSN